MKSGRMKMVIDSIPEGGRGLAIIKEIMDSVTYTSKQGENCFTMIKKLH